MIEAGMRSAMRPETNFVRD